jgi:hypothetical protein
MAAFTRLKKAYDNEQSSHTRAFIEVTDSEGSALERARAELEEQQVRLRMADSQLKVAQRAVTDYLAAVGMSSPDEVFRMLEAALDAAED